jgi:formiminoglutamase
MLDLNDYFNPVSLEKPDFEHLTGPAGFSHNIAIHTENSSIKDIRKYRVAIMGVPDGRNSPFAGTEKGPDIIRERLYRLARIPGKSKIIDLGNMKKGITFNDTLAGLTDILTLLIHENVFPLIIGGSSSLVTAVDRCFSNTKTPYTLAAIDSRIDLHSERKESDSFNYLNQIIYNQKAP